MRRLQLFLPASLCAGALLAQSPPPKTLEPDYGPDSGKPTVILPLLMEFVVFPNGTLYSATAKGTSVPLPVTRAFAKYRFPQSEKPYSLLETVRVPFILEKYSGSSRVFSAIEPEIFKLANSFTPEKALQAEGKLKANTDSVRTRSALIYFAHSQNDPKLLALRERQIAWLVENEPRATILRTPSATLSKAISPDAYAEIKQLWTNTLNKIPGQLELLEAASNFMRVSDPESVQRLLLPYAQSLPVMAWLGEAYALGGIGITNLGTRGGASTTVDSTLPQAPSAANLRSALTRSPDLPLLTSGFHTLSLSAWSLLDSHVALPEGFEGFCESVRVRIRELKPNFEGECKFEAPAPAADNATETSTVSKGLITKQIAPKYPPEAKAAGVAGQVVLSAVIGKNGKIQQLDLISGPLLLVEAAVSAVSQWEYRPYMLNGKPVEVVSEIEVNFALR